VNLKNVIWPAVAALVIMLAGAYLLRTSSADYYTLEARDIKETLITVGRIEPVQQVELAFQTAGILKKVHVAEGTAVAEQVLLVELENSQEKNNLAQRQADLNLARNTVGQQIAEDYASAVEELKQVAIDEKKQRESYERNKFLFTNGALSSVELAESKSAWEQEVSRQKAVQLKLQALGEKGSVRQEASLNLEKAQLDVKSAHLQLAQKSLTAPFNGTVTELAKQPGEYVQLGEPVLTLASAATRIEAEIDEKELAKLREGMEARVTLPTDTTKYYPAKVQGLAPKIDPQKGTINVYFKPLAKLPFKPHAAVNIEITAADRPMAWAIPRSFVISEESGDAVWLWQAGRIHKEVVQVRESLSQWLIIEPLESKAILIEPGDYKDGQKMKLGQERRE